MLKCSNPKIHTEMFVCYFRHVNDIACMSWRGFLMMSFENRKKKLKKLYKVVELFFCALKWKKVAKLHKPFWLLFLFLNDVIRNLLHNNIGFVHVNFFIFSHKSRFWWYNCPITTIFDMMIPEMIKLLVINKASLYSNLRVFVSMLISNRFI